MAGRSALLTRSGTQTLISWISREDSPERFERTATDYLGLGYLPEATPEALAREGIPMQWTGRAAQTLGLQGAASPQAAARVLTHGRGPQDEKLRTAIKAMTRKDPRTGEEIAQERRDTMGWVLSAPKTISLLLTSNDIAVRNAAVAALELASDAAMRTLEQQVTIRRGAQGIHSEGVQGLIGVKALHYTSSAGDPHLHVHYIVNTSAPAQSDGKWRALDSKVLFAAQRVAESAFQATLRDALTRRLTLDPSTAWEQRFVGSVPTWEINDLLPAVERFSRATAHMQNIAQKISSTLGGETREQHALIWALHRQDKKSLAEALEHAMDAAIASGGNAGEALRTEWRHWLGHEKTALDQIAERTRIPAPDDRRPLVSRLRGILDGSQAAQRETARQNADHRAAQTQMARDHFRHNHGLWSGGGRRIPNTEFQRLADELQAARQVRFAGIFHKEDKQAVTRIQEQIVRYQQFNQLWDQNAAAQDQTRTIRAQTGKADADAEQTLQHIRGLAAAMGQRLGPFITADLTAYWVGWGVSVDDAHQLTADTLRFWHQEGLIHFPEGIELDAVLSVVRRGQSTETRLNQQVWSHAGKIVSDALLKNEIALYDQAIELSQVQRHWLAVDVTGLTPDQATAAATIAQGQALTTIQGVAGAGKTHMMQPIVAAAQKQGLDVLVLARNAKLAQELGTELHVRSSTLAKWSHRQTQTARPTLVILDEAGLVDQPDWHTVLDRATQEPLQIVALGDRYQAQAIDRLATWAVVNTATQNTGSYAELTQTFRNATWADEATLLRHGEAEAAYRAEDGHRIWAARDGHGADRVADLVLKLTRRGEDTLGIAATNEAAAAIAESIQRRQEITVDPRTTLRWGQKTGPGDTVRTRKNDRAAKIHNGDTWTVHHITDQGLHLQAQDGRRVTVPHLWARDHLELAYAATVDSAQGVTVDRAVVFLGPGMGHSRLYSAATRGRQAPVYVAETQPSTIPARVQATEAVEAALLRDDIAPTMQEILHNHRASQYLRDAQSAPAHHSQGPQAPQRQVPAQPLPATPPVRIPFNKPARFNRDPDHGIEH